MVDDIEPKRRRQEVDPEVVTHQGIKGARTTYCGLTKSTDIHWSDYWVYPKVNCVNCLKSKYGPSFIGGELVDYYRSGQKGQSPGRRSR